MRPSLLCLAVLCGCPGAGAGDDRPDAQVALPACVCFPSCAGRQCGEDGCGKSCGTCPVTLSCDFLDGLCVTADPPECTGRQCGPDHVGGSCGACPAGWTCAAPGQCLSTSDAGCDFVPDGGLCITAVSGSWTVTCALEGARQTQCPPRTACSESGGAHCEPIPPPTVECDASICEGAVYRGCLHGKLAVHDCSLEGLACGPCGQGEPGCRKP